MYLIIAILMITMACSKERISDKIWLNHIDDQSAKIDEYNLDDKTMESHALNEGFLLPSNHRKKSSLITPTSTDSSVVNRNSALNGTLSTTCKTISVIDVKNQIPTPSDDTDLDKILVERSISNDGFLKVDDEQLSKELMNIGLTMDGSGDGMDGSGDTTELTSETTVEFTEPATSATITMNLTTMSSSITTTTTLSTTTPAEAMTSTTTLSTTTPAEAMTSTTTLSTTTPAAIVLSGYSTFVITVNCTNANATLMDILNQFNRTFRYWYNVTYNNTNLPCQRSFNINVFLTFFTGNNITVLTDLFRTLENIASNLGIILDSINTCGIPQTITVKDVTSCYLIDQCSLCGTDPPRGVCLPERNVSRCQCFIDENNPSISYVDEFCTTPKENEITSTLASWVPIVVGILAGIAGLFCVIISCFLIRIIYRRRSKKSENSNPDEIQPSPQWYLPQVPIPTPSPDHADNDTNKLIPTPGSTRSNSKHSSTKFDQKLNEPDGSSVTYYNDPINQLDEIFDNEDVEITLNEYSDSNFQLNTNSQ